MLLADMNADYWKGTYIGRLPPELQHRIGVPPPSMDDVGGALIVKLRRAASIVNRTIRGFLVRKRAPSWSNVLGRRRFNLRQARYLDAMIGYRGWNCTGMTLNPFRGFGAPDPESTGSTFLDRGITALTPTGYTEEPRTFGNIPLSMQ